MNLLPSEKIERIEEAIETFQNSGELSILEPCDCGSQIRHNNGGNYHDEICLKRDSGRYFMKRDTSCELVPPAQWKEIALASVSEIIRLYADWL